MDPVQEIDPVVVNVLKPSSLESDLSRQSVLEKLINQEWTEEDLYIEKQSAAILSREQFTQAAATTKTNRFRETFKKTYLSPIDEQSRHVVLNNHRAFKVSIDESNKSSVIFLHYPHITSDMETPVIRIIPIKENGFPLGHGSTSTALSKTDNSAATVAEGIELPVNMLVDQGNYLIQVEPVHALATSPKRFFITLERENRY